MIVIGFVGRAGAGKNTAASILKSRLEEDGFSCVEVAFADTLKGQLACMFNNGDVRPFHDRSLKETMKIYRDHTPRQLMQMYGMAMRKTFGDNVWVDVLKNKLSGMGHVDCVIVTDVRFVEEADMILSLPNSILYFIHRATQQINHASEDVVDRVLEKYKNEMIHLHNNHSIDYFRVHIIFMAYLKVKNLIEDQK